MVKIGIDAVPLVKLHGGVSYYIFYLLDELIQLRKNDEFILFVDRDGGDVGYFKKYPNVSIFVVSSFSLGHSIWSQTFLAFASWKTRIDIFWGTTQSIPLFRRSKMKTLLTLYDFVYLLFPETVSTYKMIYLRLFSNKILKAADVILPISHGTATKLKQIYSIEAKAIIPPPLKPKIYYRSAMEPILKDHSLEKKNYLITLGTFEPRKNFSELLSVYFKLLETDAEKILPLVMIGAGGWKNRKIIEMIKMIQEKYPKKLITLGYVEDDEIAQFLSGARYLVFPSKYEGYGMPLSEARVCQTPVISIDHPEMREAAENDGIFLSEDCWETEIIPFLYTSSEIKIPHKTRYETNQEIAKKIAQFI